MMSEAEQGRDPILDAALDYARMGWAVFPTGGPGKTTKEPHPMVGRWSQVSTADPAAVVHLFTGLEGPLGIGLDCGKSGLVALDVDREDQLTLPMVKARKDHPTWEHQGNRERFTMLYRDPSATIRCPPQDWGEVKGAGGYIVLAPTIHVSGVPYQWTRRDGDLPEIPTELARTLIREGNPSQPATSTEVDAFMRQHLGTLKPQALDGPLGQLRKVAAEGGSLYPALVKVLTWAMEEAAAGLYLPTEASDQIRDAWLEGYAQQGRKPRPDWLAEYERALAWAVGQVTSGDLDVEQRRIRAGVVDVSLFADTIGTRQPEPEDPLERWRLVDWETLWNEDEGEDWLLEPLISASRAVTIYSPPGHGKSLLAQDIAATLATGKGGCLGTEPTRAVPVLYLDLENVPQTDIKPRLEAMGYHWSELGKLHLSSYPDMAPLDTAQGARELLEVVDHLGIQVLVVDTMSRVVGGEENVNDTWLAFSRLTALPLKRRGVAVLRLDHTGKDESKGTRGGSAKQGDPDAVWRLKQMTDDGTHLELVLEKNRFPITEQAISIRRETGPLRHEADARPTTAFVTGVDEARAWLDAEGHPASIGRRPAERLAKAAGHKWSRNQIAHAVRKRKQAAGLLDDLDGGDTE
jgi:hypothetical protein